MAANPEEWLREILKKFPENYDPVALVNEEYQLIDEAVSQVGWEGIWNQRGSRNLGSSGYSPTAKAKQKERAKDPEVIARAKKSKQSFLEANPTYFDKLGQTLKQVWGTSEMREFAKKRATIQFQNAENRKKASQIKKEHLASHPEDILKSVIAFKKARQDSVKEAGRVLKIKTTMLAKSEEFSRREIAKHRANPEIGKNHGEKLKLLNQKEPKRLARMSESAKNKSRNRPDLVANSLAAMNSVDARKKMKATHLAKSGKWVQITFSDGEVLSILGANEASRILGINKIKTKAQNGKIRKPIPCSTEKYLGKIVTEIKYIEQMFKVEVDN